MQEINLYHLLRYYISKWQYTIAAVLVGLLFGLIYNNYIQKPLYQSTTKLVLVSSPTTQTANDQTIRINDYINLMQSRKVLQPVVDKKQTDMSFEQLTNSIDATNQKNTGVIDLTVSTPNDEQSKNIANAITASFKKVISELYENDNILIVDPAVKADQPYNVNSALQLAIASAIGFLVATILILFSYDSRQIRETTSLAKYRKNPESKTKSPRKSRKK